MKEFSKRRIEWPCHTLAMMPAGLILVVEDDDLLRMNLALLLEDQGYSTLEASSADEAIAILEARDDIRLIVTDVQMPGSMDGLKLSHAVSKKWPPIKIIVTSGRALPPMELPEGAIFLPKSYDSVSVSREVELLLGPKGSEVLTAAGQ